jgi:putative photosynthetic complex assembly protein
VRVEDGATAEVLARYGPGEGGFVRASVRSLVHQRRIRGQGPQVAFDLIRWSDGSLTLSDPVTGYTVEVSAFGPFNRAVFERMLPVGEGR